MSGLHPDLDSREWLRVTLSSIGDAVITTDREGRCTFLNPVAEKLTGWTSAEAAGVELTRVFHIVHQESREEVENPALRSLREGVIVGLANHTLLLARDGTEHPIDASAAPIREGDGEIAGTVLVFRDITERYAQEALLKATLEYTVNILDTQRQPFLVLDHELRVVTGNRAFYQTFGLAKQETEGRFVYDVGEGQWNDPRLRERLEDILPHDSSFDDFEVTQRFESVGEAPEDDEAASDTAFLRERLRKWCENGLGRIEADVEDLQMHKAVRNVTRLFERIQDFEKRVVKRRGALSRADAEAQVEALVLLAEALVPFAPHAGEALLARAGVPVS